MGFGICKMGVANYGIRKKDAHYKCFDMGSVVDVQPQYPVEVSADGIVDNRKISWKRSLNSENGKNTTVDAKEITHTVRT